MVFVVFSLKNAKKKYLEIAYCILMFDKKGLLSQGGAGENDV